FRLRTILSLLATIVAVAVALEVIWIARHVLTWVLISLFLALALNPAVEWFQRHGISRRGWAAALTYVLTVGLFAGIGFTFVPAPQSASRRSRSPSGRSSGCLRAPPGPRASTACSPSAPRRAGARSATTSTGPSAAT